MNGICVAGFGEALLRLSPEDKLRFSQVFPEKINAVFGSGKVFCNSIVYTLSKPSKTVVPKTADGRFRHTVYGDYNMYSAKEAVSLMEGNISGCVSR